MTPLDLYSLVELQLYCRRRSMLLPCSRKSSESWMWSSSSLSSVIWAYLCKTGSSFLSSREKCALVLLSQPVSIATESEWACLLFYSLICMMRLVSGFPIRLNGQFCYSPSYFSFSIPTFCTQLQAKWLHTWINTCKPTFSHSISNSKATHTASSFWE